MFNPDLLFAIDVSGTPFTKTVVSCVSFNINYCSKFLSDFNKNFKYIKNKKGKDLNNNQLKDILKFLDYNKIRSLCAYISRNDWEYALSNIPENKAHKVERIFGIIYFIILEKNAKTKHPYLVNLCEENFMQIDRVISTCRRIAKMRGFDFSFSKSSAKYNEYIRISDLVASAVRNIKTTELQNYSYCNVLSKIRLPEMYIKKAFR